MKRKLWQFPLLMCYFLFLFINSANALSMPAAPILVAEGYSNYWAESKVLGFQTLINEWEKNNSPSNLPDLPDMFDKYEGAILPTNSKTGAISLEGAIYLALKGGRDRQFWYVEGLDEFKFALNGGLSNYIAFGKQGPSPVPEPSTILLLSAGIVGLAGYKRKKLRKR